MVKADLREGYISRDTAINVYGLAPKEADEIISRYWYHPKGH
jgi:hypothetical protein